jgi:hypothetical protein
MAASINHKLAARGGQISQGLIKGDFDIETLIAELTVEEKASLLSGIVATYPNRSEATSNHM